MFRPFPGWLFLHLRHLHFLPPLSQAHQPLGLLRVMGEHTLQCWDFDISVGNHTGRLLSSLPVARLLDPVVLLSVARVTG